MIRVNFALRRLPRLSREDFQGYWRERHGPLVAGLGGALRMYRYLQSHTLDEPFGAALRDARGGMEEPYDGIASVWWLRRDDLATALESPEGGAAGKTLLEDERNFIDLERSAIWLSQEIPQINPMPENSIVAAPGSSWLKICYLLRPRPGLSPADCRATWSADHGYLIRRHSGVTRFARYIQNHTLEDPLGDALRASRGAGEPYTGLTEAWFDRYDLQQILGDSEGAGAQAFGLFLEDEKRFIDFDRSGVFLTSERVFIDSSGR